MTHALVRIETCCHHFAGIVLVGTEEECEEAKGYQPEVDGETLLVVEAERTEP